MRIVLFYHSLVSDWNHGNAHFLRGYASELLRTGHEVRVFEPADGWSRRNLLEDHGEAAVAAFRRRYRGLRSEVYKPGSLDLDRALGGADLVIAHEWNDAELIRRLGRARRRRPGMRLLFHDTHHRAATKPAEMARYDLRHYDGVLAYGRVLADLYLKRGWSRRAWVWHEAADVRVFRPARGVERDRDLVWIGNWGDNERTAELREFLLRPVRELRLRATVHGVRYPARALGELRRAGVEYAGWLANFSAPHALARGAATVHVPRRPYTEALPGIPTIRVFEALACGTPLVCAPWDDAEGLFSPGTDYLVARNGREMIDALRWTLERQDEAAAMAVRGRRTILRRHTCEHRVEELMEICRELGLRADAGEARVRGGRREVAA